MLEEDADDLGEALRCGLEQRRNSQICRGAVHLTSAMAPTIVEKHMGPLKYTLAIPDKSKRNCHSNYAA